MACPDIVAYKPRLVFHNISEYNITMTQKGLRVTQYFATRQVFFVSPQYFNQKERQNSMKRREMLLSAAGLLAGAALGEKALAALAGGDKAKKEYLIKECGLTFDHLGLPTDEDMKWDAYLENLKLHIQEYENDPFGIEWMKFEPGSPMPEIIQKRPHVAFVVNDLAKATKGYELLVPVSEPRPGMKTCFIVHKGIAVEFVVRPK